MKKPRATIASRSRLSCLHCLLLTAYRLLLQLHRPVRILQKRLPRLILAQRQLQVEQRAAFWLLRLADQRHMGLLRRAAAFLDVALDAGANDVLPRRMAALAARDDVVQAQFRGRELLAAELALIVVAGENVAAVELHRLLGQLL